MVYAFDLDGTLLDHHHAQMEGLRSLVSFSPGIREFEDETLGIRWRTAEATHFVRYESGEVSIEEHRRARLRDVFPEFCHRLGSEELDEMYGAYLQGYESGWRLFDDAKRVLDALRSVKKALITNGSKNLQRRKIQALGLERHFPVILISEEFNGYAKPDHRIFLEATRRLNLPPASVTFVGDSFSNDIVGSTASGMRATWINREGAPSPSDKGVIYRQIRSLDELLEL